MCVGRYAAKVMRNERSEMEHNRSEMPAKSYNKHASQRDAISPLYGYLMLSHSAGMHNTDISIAGISKRFHFASLHYIFSAYLPTHIKFLTEFHRIFFGTTCISFPKSFCIFLEKSWRMFTIYVYLRKEIVQNIF